MRHGAILLASALIAAGGLHQVASVQGQEHIEDCDPLCICVTDVTCGSDAGCDAGGRDCESVSFTIPCTSGDDYRLEVILSCSECQHCFACGIVATPSGGWVQGLQRGCDAAGCSTGQSFHLSGGSYKLLACLRRCAASTCTSCADCSAKVRLYSSVDDCSAPCNW